MSNYASPEEYNLADLLCCAASREVQDNEIVFAGTGLVVTALLARGFVPVPQPGSTPVPADRPSLTRA